MKLLRQEEEPFDYSIAICTLNRGEVLFETVKSCIAEMLSSSFFGQIIIVDQSDRANVAIKKLLEESRIDYVYELSEVRSLTIARNRCLAIAKSRVVVFVDDDVFLSEGFIKHHIHSFDDDRVKAVVGSIFENGRFEFVDVNNNRPSIFGRQKLNFQSKNQAFVRALKGCNMSFRCEYILRLGGFDEKIPTPFLREDTDIALRICRSGGEILYQPKANLVHHQVPSGGTADSKKANTPGQFSRMPWLNKNSYACEIVFQIKNFGYLSLVFFFVYCFLYWVLFKNYSSPSRFYKAIRSFISGSKEGIFHYIKYY